MQQPVNGSISFLFPSLSLLKKNVAYNGAAKYDENTGFGFADVCCSAVQQKKKKSKKKEMIKIKISKLGKMEV